MVGGHHFLFSSSSATGDSGSRTNLRVCRWPSGQAKVTFGTFQCRVFTSLPLYHDSMLQVSDKRKLRAGFLFLKRGPHFYFQSTKIKIQSLFTHAHVIPNQHDFIQWNTKREIDQNSTKFTIQCSGWISKHCKYSPYVF